MNATVRYGADGSFTGAVAALSDVTAHVERERELLAELECKTLEPANARDSQERIENRSRDFVEIAESVAIARDQTQQALIRAKKAKSNFGPS